MVVIDPFSINEVGSGFSTSDLTNNPPKIMIRSSMGGVYSSYSEFTIRSISLSNNVLTVVLVDTIYTTSGARNTLTFTLAQGEPVSVTSSYTSPPGGGSG